MIDETNIQKNLEEIEALYLAHIGDKEGMYYSKLAILEVCGWIEVSIDCIVEAWTKKYLKDQHNIGLIRDLIDRTSSFEYQNNFRDNFRNMLLYIVGIVNLEKLESQFNPRKFELMRSSLGTLKKIRDLHAHTYLAGTTPTIHAPSSTIKHFVQVYEGLKDIESCISRLVI